MPRVRRDFRIGLETLEARLTMSASAAAAPLPGAAETIATLREFTRHYPTRSGEPNYDPAFDLNHNGLIGQGDGQLLLRALPPVAPRRPLRLAVILAPDSRARGSTPTNLGGVTQTGSPTILGRTSPGALIFTGTGTVDLRLTSPAYVADERGEFSVTLDLTDQAHPSAISQFDLKVVDRYGQQTLRAFPIRWTGFARYWDAHPRIV